MKKLMFLAVMTIGFLSFSQEKEETESNEIKYKCSSLIKTNNNTIELIGNVEFKSDLIEFINAEKVFYNKETKEVTVYKPNKIVFHGASMQVPPNSKNQIINYKIGGKVAYMN